MNKVIQQWNKKYSGDELVFGSTPNEFLTTQARQLEKHGHILCVGDGEGRNGVWLAQQGFKVHSVDGAINGVTKAIAQAEHRGVADRFTGECADLTQWDWPNGCYDGVACLHLYFMPNERTALHHKMISSLKEGGLFILEVFHPDNVGRNCGGPKLRELCYSADMLQADFQDIAEILLLEETERTVAPSSFHSGGVGKVTRLVATKKGVHE